MVPHTLSKILLMLVVVNTCGSAHQQQDPKNVPSRSKSHLTKVPYTPLASPSRHRPSSSSASGLTERLEKEYLMLLAVTEDKDSLEAIRDLHRQLDNDKDGTIEPDETGEYMRGDLYQAAGTDSRRGKHFHDKDAEITVKDLWETWHHSEVFNWTEMQIEQWVIHNVELPQYVVLFRKAGINGSHLPKMAASPHFLSRVVGISSPIHRSKITLKAMDLVLFGPPRDQSTWKDTILTSLLVLAVSCLCYAYRQNKKSKGELKKMMADLDSLAKAEETLQDLQEKLQQKDSKIESLSSTPSDVPDTVEINRLREELDMLKMELQRAEVELEDRCWVVPPVLQHWLQLTYEMESVVYNAKKKAAEEQLEAAKDMCEKLKRKRSSLVGAFISTHGSSIDNVDRSILEAKAALMELTKDLTERSQRWKQIEMLCGCSIINNPGITILKGMVRHVGIGRGAGGGAGLTHRGLGSSIRSGNTSQEDLLMDELDSHSVSGHSIAAPSSSHISTSLSSKLASSSPSHYAGSLSGQLLRKRQENVKTTISRESMQDSSSSSDELLHCEIVGSGDGKLTEEPEVPADVPNSNSNPPSVPPSALTQSASDGQLQRQQHRPRLHLDGGSVGSGLVAIGGSLSATTPDPSSVPEEEEGDGGASCSASESGSLAELNSGLSTASIGKVKESKKRSFFNFKKKKEAKDAM